MFNVISDFEMIIQNLKINKNCGGGTYFNKRVVSYGLACKIR